MSSPTEPIAPSPSAGTLKAWCAGASAALAGAGMALLLNGAPLGQQLWRLLPGLLPPEALELAPPAASFAGALAVGLGIAWVVAVVPSWRRVAGVLGAATVLILTQSLVFALYGIAWEPLPALFALAGAGSMAALLRPSPAFSPARWFRGRVSPGQLERLAGSAMENPAFLRPGLRDATVITCRLTNENALRGLLPAREFLKLCGAFRIKASSVLLEHGACLDPTESSGVRAFFGLPLPSASPPSPADQAVAASLALDDAMRLFAEQAALPGNVSSSPVWGIGLASGQLTAGLIGESYAVLGDPVELSRWLASETTGYEVRILADSATHLAADHIEDRPLEFVNPPEGAAVEIFQVLGTTGSLSQDTLARRQAFRDAIALLRAGHSTDALRRFDDARHGLTVRDPVIDHFISLATGQSQRDAASLRDSASASAGAQAANSPAPSSLPGAPENASAASSSGAVPPPPQSPGSLGGTAAGITGNPPAVGPRGRKPRTARPLPRHSADLSPLKQTRKHRPDAG